MTTHDISGGTVHPMTDDIRHALTADAKVLALWEGITPLARNEYICWVENAKHIDTRSRRIRRTCEELLDGMRRPCCWIGCIHRSDKTISPSVQGMLDRQSKRPS